MNCSFGARLSLCLVQCGDPGLESDRHAQGHSSVTSGSLYLPLKLLIGTDPCQWEAPEAGIFRVPICKRGATTPPTQVLKRVWPRSARVGRLHMTPVLSCHPHLKSLAVGLSWAVLWGVILETASCKKSVYRSEPQSAPPGVWWQVG